MKPAHEKEFRDFTAAQTPALLRVAYLLTGDVHLAQDLVQSALAACVKKWHRIDEPYAYVRKAMYRSQYNAWRSRARKPESIVDAPPERADRDHADGVAARHDLRAALARLPYRQRLIVVLRHYEDRSEAEIARMLGISPSGVRSQASRGIAALRRIHQPNATGTEVLR
ncbi:SigE family RNA polymerase sigma factor [Phytomonospora endophytica]|uniref:RNA polymerase sigma-70 factor (Sigma-E family) n=1 Tax=Phytomonospora endophytica TaxID=714109 RepID=A0A841FUZ1_9ACTN|nr:SigE family RNA polymerase sigma factor [Phytomonospora endophytica]MBB6037538.1 RNA polymerase sigma-70 factor (sigma-E family) [Phytomonospora endophytica]GIG70239.1 RNA polymerase sigma24 factor [Phytomonospora endophytica]